MKRKLFDLFGNFNFQGWQVAARTLTLKLLPSVSAEAELISTVTPVGHEPMPIGAPFVTAPEELVEQPKMMPLKEKVEAEYVAPGAISVEQMKSRETTGSFDRISKELIAQSDVGSVETVKSILATVAPDQKFDLLKMTNEKQNTAVHVAALAGRADILTVLLVGLNSSQKFEILTMRQMYGKTPLHLAAASVRNKKPDAVNKLLQNLMPQEKIKLIEMKDNNGKTPLNIAQESNNHAIVVILREIVNKGGK